MLLVGVLFLYVVNTVFLMVGAEQAVISDQALDTAS